MGLAAAGANSRLQKSRNREPESHAHNRHAPPRPRPNERTNTTSTAEQRPTKEKRQSILLEITAHRRNRRLARLDLERWRVSRSGREEDEAAEEARVLGALGAARGWAEGVGADEATAADVAGVAVKTSRQNPLPENKTQATHPLSPGGGNRGVVTLHRRQQNSRSLSPHGFRRGVEPSNNSSGTNPRRQRRSRRRRCTRPPTSPPTSTRASPQVKRSSPPVKRGRAPAGHGA